MRETRAPLQTAAPQTGAAQRLRSVGSAGPAGDAGPLEALQGSTHRISAEHLDRRGIKHVRVLDETTFLSVLERMVEDRIRARLAQEIPNHTKGREDELRAQYKLCWEVFRVQYERRLKTLEERLTVLAAAPSGPEVPGPPRR